MATHATSTRDESQEVLKTKEHRLSYTSGMTQEATELLKKALTLSAEERAQLVDALLESLDEPREDPAVIEAAWNEEIARRIADLDSGKAKTIPWEEVRLRVSAKLTHGR
jgi:putative addiction module component (TIGR02574 family)